MPVIFRNDKFTEIIANSQLAFLWMVYKIKIKIAVFCLFTIVIELSVGLGFKIEKSVVAKVFKSVLYL